MSKKIYTRTGDGGETELLDGRRVPKNDPRIKAGAAVDKLNSLVGLLNSRFHDETFASDSLAVQNRLFGLGTGNLDPAAVAEVEAQIDRLNSELSPLTHFILPRGDENVACAHLCRCACREAEIAWVEAGRQTAFDDPQSLAYLNRLGDYFFVLARYIAHKSNSEEVPWRQRD